METCPHTPPAGHQLPVERTTQSAEKIKTHLTGCKTQQWSKDNRAEADVIQQQLTLDPTLWRYSTLGGAPFKSRWTNFFPLGQGAHAILLFANTDFCGLISVEWIKTGNNRTRLGSQDYENTTVSWYLVWVTPRTKWYCLTSSLFWTTPISLYRFLVNRWCSIGLDWPGR